MKKTFLLMMILSVFVFSCKNYIIENNFDNIPTDKNLDSVNELATVNLDFGSNARTVLPEFETSKLKNIVLKGKQNGGEQKTLATFANFTSLKSVGIDIGNWDFELTAQQENTKFIGNLTQTITQGENTLSFTLKVQSYGNSDDNGSVNVVLIFPNDAGVKTIKAGLFDVIEQTEVTGFETETLSFASGTAFYTKSDIPVGNYILKFEFYGDTDCKLYMNCYKELVVISSGCQSKAERAIDSLNEIYEITYELNGGAFAEGYTAPLSFTRNMTVEFVEPVREGYVFGGWYEDEGFDGEKVTQIKSAVKNRTLYAKWLRDYYISGADIYSLDLNEKGVEYSIFVNEITDSQLSKLCIKIKDSICCVNLDLGNCNSLTKINSDAFSDSYLKSIVIPKSVTTIGRSAFYMCRKLESITIPESVITIEQYAFANDYKIRNVWYGGSASQWCNINFSESYFNNPLQRDKDMNLYFKGALVRNITLDSTVKMIPDGAFGGCTSLESIVIPRSVTKIGRVAFCHCISLSSVTIPSPVKSIDIGAFFDCRNLTLIIFEDTRNWYVSSYSDREDSSPINVTNSSENVKYLKAFKYFYKD